jgi:type VI secretion system secreted protein Hcp
MKTLFKLFAALAVLCALAVATPQVAQAAETRPFSVVVKIDGAPGDSQVLSGGIDVLTYNWSATAVGNTHNHFGGKVELSPFHFVHAYDKASPVLFQFASQGHSIRTVDFYVFKTGGNAERDTIIHIKLENVLVSSINIAGHGDLPTQQVTLHYGKITWEHSKSGAKGSWDNK